MPICVSASVPFGQEPDWESNDERSTDEIAIGDFNGDGWQITTGESKTGDGNTNVFYLDHFPALTINEIMVDGVITPRYDYCYDAHAGWFSIKDTPVDGAQVEVDYVWSNSLDFFAGNDPREQTDARDVIYFNEGGNLNPEPEWISQNNDDNYGVAAADFDNDGDVDVLIGGSDFIKIYINTGSGLENEPSYCYNMPKGVPMGFAWGDVDNDDYLELAVAVNIWESSYDVSEIWVFRNNYGVLEDEPSWVVVLKKVKGVSWGDMDGDGDMDLAGSTTCAGSSPDGYAYVFRNNSGELEKRHCWKNDPPQGACRGLAWGDVNGDGRIDLVKEICGAGGGDDRYADIFYSEDGVLPTEPSWESSLYAYVINSVLVDCDGDSLLDLMQAKGSGAIGYFHDGEDLETFPSWYYVVGAPYCILFLEVGDIDGDNLPDIVMGCTTDTGYPTGGPNKLFLNKSGGPSAIDLLYFTAYPEDSCITLSWSVQTTQDEQILGFNLYRREMVAEMSPLGEDVYPRLAVDDWLKINGDLITGENPYTYTDSDVEANVAYEYKLEAVLADDSPEILGTTQATAGQPTSFSILALYPNPASDYLTCLLALPSAGVVELRLYDLSGRLVLSQQLELTEPTELEVPVDVSGLASGVYTMQASFGGAEVSARAVVVR